MKPRNSRELDSSGIPQEEAADLTQRRKRKQVQTFGGLSVNIQKQGTSTINLTKIEDPRISSLRLARISLPFHLPVIELGTSGFSAAQKLLNPKL